MTESHHIDTYRVCRARAPLPTNRYAPGSHSSLCLLADWGRAGGEGASAYPGTSYNPNVANACPKHTGDAFYISITPAAGIVDGSGPYDKIPNDPCVVKACNNLGGGDKRENCEGAPILPS